MAEKLTYREKLLPQAGEDAQAFYDRVTTQLADGRSVSKTRVLLHASKAVATAWKSLDGMENPFKAEAMDDPGTVRENLETAVILMANAIKANVAKLDHLQEPEDEIRAAIGKHGADLPKALRKQVEARVKASVVNEHEKSVKGIINGVKGPFDALMEMKEMVPEDAPEAPLMDEMAAAHADFKAARNAMQGQGKGNAGKGKRRR
jgi:hypothetical protein